MFVALCSLDVKLQRNRSPLGEGRKRIKYPHGKTYKAEAPPKLYKKEQLADLLFYSTQDYEHNPSNATTMAIFPIKPLKAPED
jgi:phosphoribosylaminoimidazole-succinocarboxamide synthase